MSEQNPNRPDPAKTVKQEPAKTPSAPIKSVASKPPGRMPDKNAIAPSGPVPPLFRRIDWLTALVATLVVFLGYFYTLAPDVTLEDSGELAVGSFYAGVPHPPGYPVWTLYTWLFTVLVPISNIAWRVALSSAVAGAVSCGLLALITSRGTSMMIEGIAELKNLEKRFESTLCILAGLVAGMLLGFNGFMWSQSVIVEVYTFSVLSLMGVLVTLLRWIYAPHQRKYLYWMAFWFGICFTNHQTLIVAAMGIEVAIFAACIALGRDLFAINTIVWLLGWFLSAKGSITVFQENPAIANIYHFVGVGSLVATIVGWWKTSKIFTEWKAALIMGGLWIVGAAFYFYMPIASMTNPPMNWGYPRTKEGFMHALTRGQYDKTTPISSIGKMADCTRMYVEGAIEEFSPNFLLIGLVPWLFFNRMQKREKAWMIGMVAIYLCLSMLLLYLLNPQTDRQAREQARVFFTASHVIIAMAIGYGVALICATLSLDYARWRRTAQIAAAVAVVFAAGHVVTTYTEIGFWDVVRRPITTIQEITGSFASAVQLGRWDLLIGLLWGVGLVVLFTVSVKQFAKPILVGLMGMMPLYSMTAHWWDNEQRGHYFGYWFGHDMFTPPFNVYPEMSRNAILFGGTDPGRFNPTYMIFCESFTPASKKPMDPNFDRRDVYLITQNALADGTYLSYIRAHYNRSAQQDPPFFVNFFRRSSEEIAGRTNAFAKMLVPLDRYFTDLGARIEERRRKDGVYPPNEIITPSVEDSSEAFSGYIADAQARLQHDMQFPTEPKKIKPGEDVRIIDNKISVQGQVAVMAINGLLTKKIFDANPTNEFYVEESFPLDWMFPHLTPFGIIMKINRNPVPEFTEEMLKKDHDFWAQYSERFIGNWITYDTPVDQICDFAERVYLRRDYKGLPVKPEFVRDDNAQKAFSKLRSAIGGLYFYRLGVTKTSAENQRVLKEAEFAFKQSFAFCPYSPEAVFKYVNLLVNLGRMKDAMRVCLTGIKFDPENQSLESLRLNLESIEKNQAAGMQAQAQVAAAEAQYKTNPANLQAAFQLASIYLAMARTNDANAVFQELIDRPDANIQVLLSVAQAHSQLGNMQGLQATLSRLVKVDPNNAEGWYDLARAEAVLRKGPESIKALRMAVQLSNARLKTNPAAKNLAAAAMDEPAFGIVRTSPDFAKALNPQEP
jgi:tetratricopeptide (TPR) repeat protein